MLRLLGAANELSVRRGRGVGAHWIVDLWGASHLTDAKVLTTVLEAASNEAYPVVPGSSICSGCTGLMGWFGSGRALAAHRPVAFRWRSCGGAASA
jgi:hypothetical protein